MKKIENNSKEDTVEVKENIGREDIVGREKNTVVLFYCMEEFC